MPQGRPDSTSTRTSLTLTLPNGSEKSIHLLPDSTARDVILRAGANPATHALVSPSSGTVLAGTQLVGDLEEDTYTVSPSLDVG